MNCFASCCDFLDLFFVDVDLYVFCGDCFSVFADMFLSLIGQVAANTFDELGFVIALPVHIASGVLSFRHNPYNFGVGICDSIIVVG